MRIESGTTSERKIRMTIFLVMCAAMGTWFALDGFWRYAAKNLKWAQEKMPVKPEEPWTNPKATVKTLRQIARGMTAQELEELVGGPILVESRQSENEPKVERRTLWFVGPAAYTIVEMKDGRVSTELIASLRPAFKGALDQAELSDNLRRELKDQGAELSEKAVVTVDEEGRRWRIEDRQRRYLVVEEDGKLNTYVAGPEVRENEEYSENDILLQKIIAIILATVSLVMAVKLVFVIRTRVVLDEAGLTLNRRHVPWDAMTGLRTDDYDRRGWVDLEYESDGVTRAQRIDGYHVERFDEVVSAICERKQFPSPIRPADAETGMDDGPEPGDGFDDDSRSEDPAS